MSDQESKSKGLEDTDTLTRSPLMMSATDTGLLVVDVQEKLIPLVAGHQRIVWNIRRLLDAASVLGVPAAATEQYPKGLGRTVPELLKRLGGASEKLTFSCRECAAIFRRDALGDRDKILVCGIETHVCVQQTVLDLLAAGLSVFVAVDAVGARYGIDHDTALRRMESAGATMTTTESAMFEICQVAGTPEFKQLSQLIRETPPKEA